MTTRNSVYISDSLNDTDHLTRKPRLKRPSRVNYLRRSIIGFAGRTGSAVGAKSQIILHAAYPHILGVDVAGVIETLGEGLGPEGGLACIAGIPDLTVVPDLPYSISIHDIGLGGVLASPAFRRRQEDLGRMATELMALVQDGKIRPTVAEQITLEAIPKAFERLAEGHVRGKTVARVQS